jgi:hypothetical protein
MKTDELSPYGKFHFALAGWEIRTKKDGKVIEKFEAWEMCYCCLSRSAFMMMERSHPDFDFIKKPKPEPAENKTENEITK